METNPVVCSEDVTVAACHSLQWSRNRSILYWTLIKVLVFMGAVISALCAFPDNPVSLRALPVDEDWHILLFTLLFIRFLGAYSRPEWLGPLVSWWKPEVCLLFCWQDALLCCFPPLIRFLSVLEDSWRQNSYVQLQWWKYNWFKRYFLFPVVQSGRALPCLTHLTLKEHKEIKNVSYSWWEITEMHNLYSLFFLSRKVECCCYLLF